jgi:hypothetical protein
MLRGAIFGGLFSAILFLALFILYIYLVVLFVKLANRGIKALDIYIAKNSHPYTYPPDPNSKNEG